MPLYYFDLETTGDDPQQDRIVMAQYEPLGDDLQSSGALQIVAEWEWGEKQLIQMLLDKGILEPTWDFVPVGNRPRFDLTFLIERATKWNLISWDARTLKYFWFTKPLLDFGTVLVLMNRGSFAGSALHAFADKESGARVPRMYREGKFSDLVAYVTKERDAALGLLQESAEVLGALGDGRRRDRDPATPSSQPEAKS